MARSTVAFRVLLCDGCCCGTVRKHPTVDHPDQRNRLGHAARAGGGTVRTTGCVDRCAHSNVVVVRHAGGRSTWLGGVLDQPSERAVARWLTAGADPDAIPDDVEPLVIDGRADAEPVALRTRVATDAPTKQATATNAIVGPDGVPR